jgi:hypothetical protein
MIRSSSKSHHQKGMGFLFCIVSGEEVREGVLVRVVFVLIFSSFRVADGGESGVLSFTPGLPDDAGDFADASKGAEDACVPGPLPDFGSAFP